MVCWLYVWRGDLCDELKHGEKNNRRTVAKNRTSLVDGTALCVVCVFDCDAVAARGGGWDDARSMVDGGMGNVYGRYSCMDVFLIGMHRTPFDMAMYSSLQFINVFDSELRYTRLSSSCRTCLYTISK